MSYLHKQKIVHRDLKPSNILINEYLHPIISDFGISKIKDQSYIDYSESRGSPYYISPEILRGEDYTEKIDVYAFSIILYQIITNLSPYKDTNNYFLILLDVRNKKRPKIPSTVPSCYKELIEECWDDDPTKRPTFESIIERLEKVKVFSEKVDRHDFNICIEFAKQFKTDYKPGNQIKKITEFVDHETQNFNEVEIKSEN